MTRLPKESILTASYASLLTINQILIFLALLGVSTVLFLLMFFIKPILFKIIKNLRNNKNKRHEIENEIKVAEIAAGYDNVCDEWFTIKTKINGKEIFCLLDSGAHVSLTGRETAEKLEIKEIFSADLSAIVGIGNKIVPTLGQGEIIFQIAGCEILTNLVILENEISKTGKYDVIIGRETLKSLPLFLDLQTGKLIAKSLIKNCRTNEAEKIKLKLVENVKLKNNRDINKNNNYQIKNGLRIQTNLPQPSPKQTYQKNTQLYKNARKKWVEDKYEIRPPNFTTGETAKTAGPPEKNNNYQQKIRFQTSKQQTGRAKANKKGKAESEWTMLQGKMKIRNGAHP